MSQEETASAISNLQENGLTRREFISLIVRGATAGSYLLTPKIQQHLVMPIIEQYFTWLKADTSNELFLKDNERKLARVRIGGSFSPEQASFLYREAGEEDDPLKNLQYIVEELHIRDLRLGIRWSEVMRQRGKVNISNYTPYLNYCFKNGVNLCLNVGPIKTFRWREQHIPDFLRDNSLPAYGALITSDMEIAKEATEYYILLLHQLNLEYGKDLKEKVKIVQIDNEPSVKFGEFGWVMSINHLENLIDITQTYFPQSKYLFNSGPFAIDPISHLFDSLAKRNIKLVYGTDYYPWIDDHTNPYSKLLHLPLINSLDLITLSKMAGQPIQPISKTAFDREATEIQFEGWGRHYTPGNSVRDFMYILLRCMNDILDINTNQIQVARLWGLEAFARKMMAGVNTEDHNRIVRLIHAVNQNSDRQLAA